MALLCNGCRECCKGDAIVLHPEQGDIVENYITVPFIHPISKEQVFMLDHKPNGDCIYLGEVGCTNYENRPLICREYDCRKQYLSLTKKQRMTLVSKGLASKESFEAGKRRINSLSQAERKQIRSKGVSYGKES